MRRINIFATVATALLLPVAAVSASAADGATKVDPKDKVVCKRVQKTGTRFQSQTCKTVAQWDALAEQHKRDAAELINRPQIEIRRE